jgi:hypothetical protein
LLGSGAKLENFVEKGRPECSLSLCPGRPLSRLGWIYEPGCGMLPELSPVWG